MRLTYPDMDRRSLVKSLLKEMKMHGTAFRDMIRNYSANITELRDKILLSANININDWLNDNYNEDQLVSITTNISKIIANLNKK